MEIIDRLLGKSCYIIDYLPVPVPKDSKGQFFEVEEYLLNHFEHYGLRDRFIGIVLKLMCYYHTSVFINGEWKEQPSPDVVVELIKEIVQKSSDSLNIRFSEKDALLVMDGDCLNMTVYNPDEEMCILLKDIAASEGVFFRKGRE